MKRALIAIVILAVVGGLAYSLMVTFKTGASAGVVTCLEDKSCIWTAHIHSYLPLSICGKDTRLPIEVGALTGPHTHEEKNIAHWHDKLPYDKVKQAITNIDPLRLSSFFEAIEVPFGADHIMHKRNGDLCDDGKPGTLSVFINGELETDFTSYVWKDHDIIRIFFDSRPIEAIAEEVEANPAEFPKLGRG
jgi:hypothetical protein